MSLGDPRQGHARHTRAAAGELVNLDEIAEIELFIVKRMKEFTVGDHASVFKGGGFNFVGVRDWQPGDRMSSIDWAQSSMTNFSPMIVKDFEQDSNAVIVAVADASLSTRCGVHGSTIAAAIARAVAAAGLSAVFFQDMFGLITFDQHFHQVAAVRPRVGRTHVLHCLDVYARPADAPGERDIVTAIEGQLRRSSLVPIVSDFLFPDAARVIRELAQLNAVHDILLLMADVRFAYEWPGTGDGWVEAYDIESGGARIFSRREMRRLAERVGEWQTEIGRIARDAGIDVVRVGLDRWEMENTLVAFAAERRLRKIA
jgi:uncharacterized protein (DUF58 family)